MTMAREPIKAIVLVASKIDPLAAKARRIPQATAGADLTVQAVQDGKVAAHAIDRWLRAGAR